MKKLSFEALQAKAAHTNQDELLTSVSGGTFGDCHPCSHVLNGPQMDPIEGFIHSYTCNER